jgi:cytochrome c
MKFIQATRRLGPALAVLIASASPTMAQSSGDAAAGAEVFQKCVACHKVGLDAKNGIGPSLNGVVGRDSGSLSDYNYSRAMKDAHLTWNVETLARYLKAPQEVVRGTKMTLVGLTSDKEIADVIAYLAGFDAEGEKKAP